MIVRLSFLRFDHSRQGRIRFVVAATVAFAIYSVIIVILNGKAYVDRYMKLVGYQYLAGNASRSSVCETFEDIQALPTTDECLLTFLRDKILIPPSSLDYNLTETSTKHPSKYAQELKTLFENKTDGFFIECGANDGEYISNTLALEMNQNWTGLLVEAHPKFREKLLNLHRKAWFAGACLAPYNNISKLNFLESKSYHERWLDAVGKLDLGEKKKHLYFRNAAFVPCFPLVSIMAALGVTHVDYFSLDVEGVELKILKTLPFDETLTIDYIQVENNRLPEGKPALRAFMLSKGYELVMSKDIDYIFKRVSRN